MAYDATSSRVLVFGGSRPGVGNLGDTWAWDGTRWTELATATPRTHPRLGALPSSGRPVVIGGLTPTGPANTMLVLDQNVWQSVNVSGPLPRYLAGVAFDGRRGVLVMFGGGDAGGMALYSDTWEYDGTTWRNRR